MAFELAPLPYAIDALEPFISKRTLEFHHGKHHLAYVNKLNELIQGTEFAALPLETIIQRASGPIFNNAAQHWNHAFYWSCMKPQGGGEPTGALAAAINKAFGSFAEFKAKFTAAAMGQFGSGWAWLVKNAAGQLAITSTSNAGNPMTEGSTPIMTCDVWEHAYYLDTQNLRARYVENFWHVVHWDFAAKNFGG